MYRQKRRREGTFRFGAPLDKERIDRLDALGVQWLKRKNPFWTHTYNQLVSFKEKHGHCDIPTKKKYKRLRSRIYIQKIRRSKGYRRERRLTPKQAEKLEELGLDWDDFDSDDEENTSSSSSASSKDSSGDDDDDSDGSTISSSPRRGSGFASVDGESVAESYSSASLVTPGEEIDRSQPEWNAFFNELVEFERERGHCIVPDSEEWIHLSHWLYKQKRCRDGDYHGSPQLTENQIDKMDALGVIWLEDETNQTSSMDQGDGFFCKIKLLQDDLVIKEVGFIVLPLRTNSTFVDARRRIMDTFSFPDWFAREYAEWSFYIPSRGPLSMKEEVSLGPMYAFLQQLGPRSNFSPHGDAEVLIGPIAHSSQDSTDSNLY